MDDESFITGLREIVQANVVDYHPMLKGGKPDEIFFESEVKQYMSPWFRYFITYNPTENLTKVKCPLLAVNGTLDLQVSNDENLAAIEAAMKESKNPEYKITSYKGAFELLKNKIECHILK